MNKRLTTQSACGVWELERNDKQYTFTFTHNPNYYAAPVPLRLVDKMVIRLQTTYTDHLIHRVAFTVDNLHMRMDQFCKGIPLGIVDSWVWDCLRPLGLAATIADSVGVYLTGADGNKPRQFYMPKIDTLSVEPYVLLYSYQLGGSGNPFQPFSQ